MQSCHLWNWSEINVVSEVAEKSAGDSPQNVVGSIFVFFQLFLDDSLGFLVEDDLVVTGENVATSYLFEHDSCLEEQAAIGDRHCLLLQVTGPEEESWVAGLSVNCDEVKVIVERGKGGSNFVVLL